MTKESLASVLGVEAWPEEYEVLLERFNDEWDTIKEQPLLDMQAARKLAEEGFIAPEQFSDAEECLELMENDESLAFAFQCLFYVLCVYRGAHENELYIEPVPPSLGEFRFTFSMVLLMKILIHGVEKARARHIPEELIEQHKGAANGGIGEEGRFGTPGMFHWRVVCAFATMYQLGAFRYEPERVPPGYRMLRRKADGALLMVYTAERSFDEFGQFSSPEHAAFVSKLSVGKTDGYLVHPNGSVVDRYVALPEDEWETAFDGGDAALSFHIPSGIPYHIEALCDSFEKAIAFYSEYYPDLPVRSIQSYSWLYSPQLTSILSTESGINRLNRELYLAPVPSGADGFYSFVFQTDSASFDLQTAPTDTSLKRGFVSFVKNGGRVHNGFMYFPAADVGRLCEDAHRLYAWDILEE